MLSTPLTLDWSKETRISSMSSGVKEISLILCKGEAVSLLLDSEKLIVKLE